MEMTEFEIVRSYKEAKYPKEQIKILADINLCPPKQIIDILTDNGLDVPQNKSGRPKVVRADDTITRHSTSRRKAVGGNNNPIPDSVVRFATSRMEELDARMQTLKKQELEIKTEIDKIIDEYTQIAKFLGL